MYSIDIPNMGCNSSNFLPLWPTIGRRKSTDYVELNIYFKCLLRLNIIILNPEY